MKPIVLNSHVTEVMQFLETSDVLPKDPAEMAVVLKMASEYYAQISNHNIMVRAMMASLESLK